MYHSLDSANREKLSALFPGLELGYQPFRRNWSEEGDIKVFDFGWEFQPKGTRHKIRQHASLTINLQRYTYYRSLPRFNGEWNRYAEEEMPEIRELTEIFQELHLGHNWSTYNQASNVLKFVQVNAKYKKDLESTGYEDWAKYPIETLYDRCGDCEDLAILCGAILARLGFRVVLLLYGPVASVPAYHLAFGISGAENLQGDYVIDPTSQSRYFYGEATSEGWHLGEIPVHYRGEKPKFYPIEIKIRDDDGIAG